MFPSLVLDHLNDDEEYIESQIRELEAQFDLGNDFKNNS